MKKRILVFIILILIIVIPLSHYNKGIINNSKNLIDTNEIIYVNDKSITLAKGDTIHLELSLKENETNTLYSLTICIMKVESELNKDGIISLITSLDDINTYSDILYHKTLNIENILTTSFDIESDGKYIIFVLDEEKIIAPSKLDVNYIFTIGGENDKSDSSIILL